MKKQNNTVLFMLPYAGGSAYNLMGLAREIKYADARVLEWPGRGRRVAEPLLTSLPLIVEDLLGQIIPVLVQYESFAFYGHSMGTTLCHLLIKELAECYHRYPKHLFVSGSAGPAKRAVKGWHTLDAAAFWERVATLGGCPDELLASPELLEFVEPILRADFQALDQFEYRAPSLFPLPITAIRGQNDEQDKVAFESWQNETAHPLELIEMPGNHFFIFQNEAAIGALLSDRLLAQSPSLLQRL